MEKYTIFCTKEQARKALELGAPVQFKTSCHYDLQNGKFIPYPDLDIDINGEPILIPPTAEQMCGWLREQGEDILIRDYSDGTDIYWQVAHRPAMNYNCGYSPSYKVAALAAIDAALEHLSRNKKEEE